MAPYAHTTLNLRINSRKPKARFATIVGKGKDADKAFPFQIDQVIGEAADAPGTDVCAAIYRKGSCPNEAANASAMLLEGQDALSISQW